MAFGRRAHASAWLILVVMTVVLLQTSGGDDTLKTAGVTAAGVGGFAGIHAIIGTTHRRTARLGIRAADAGGSGDCEWATHLYQRALSISPTDPHVLAISARNAWESEGRHNKAEELLERAMALQPRNPTVALEAARSRSVNRKP
jgi:hypothetical protein